MTEQVLTGLKVLDLTQSIAGPFCTKLLADYGAEVIKIERPGSGDPARRAGPFPGDIPHPEKSGLFLYLNTNKQGVTLNLKTRTGTDIFKELVKRSDILVESFSPRVMPGLGLDYETLKQIKPDLVMTSISNFGQSGPYRDWQLTELTSTALSGQMYKLGDPDREPLKHALNIFQYYAGKIAGVATVAAAIRHAALGNGEHIDISLFEIMVCDINNRLIEYDYSGDRGSRKTAKNYPLFPWGGFPAKDGYVAIQGTNRARWEPRLFEMIGKPEWKKDPRFVTDKAREANKEIVNEVLFAWLKSHTKQEIADAAAKARYPAAAVYNNKELLENEHYRARGFFVDIEHPAAGKLTYPGPAFQISEAGYANRLPAPLLGQHNKEIYCDLLGYSPAELSLLGRTGVI